MQWAWVLSVPPLNHVDDIDVLTYGKAIWQKEPGSWKTMWIRDLTGTQGILSANYLTVIDLWKPAGKDGNYIFFCKGEVSFSKVRDFQVHLHWARERAEGPSPKWSSMWYSMWGKPLFSETYRSSEPLTSSPLLSAPLPVIQQRYLENVILKRWILQ